MPSSVAMAAYPSSHIRPASVIRISSTTSVTPGRVIMGSVTIVASLASTRPESISMEKPCANRKCSARPRGVLASFSRARRCSRLGRDAEDAEGLLRVRTIWSHDFGWLRGEQLDLVVYFLPIRRTTLAWGEKFRRPRPVQGGRGRPGGRHPAAARQNGERPAPHYVREPRLSCWRFCGCDETFPLRLRGGLQPAGAL